jgi:hypothetical protein
MGGASLCVLSPRAADQAASITVEAMLAEGLTRRGATDWYSAAGLPHAYDIADPDFEIEPESLRTVEEAAGVTMRCQIQVHIVVSDLAGRPLLARLAQAVALGGEGWALVEFAGPPPADLVGPLLRARHAVRTDDFSFDAVGTVVWIAHPGFHVVK